MKNNDVYYEVNNHIAYVYLNRPEKRNAINKEMFYTLVSLAKEIQHNRDIRAVILQGQGDDFCAGIDLATLKEGPKTVLKLLFKWLPGQANTVQQSSLCWRSLPIPVIAVIQGNCLGGGLQLALGCDFRIASPDSHFSIMESKWGIMPDMAGLEGLRGNVSKDWALKVSLTGELIDGQTAFQQHLISAISDSPLALAEKWCQAFIDRSPDAIAAIKKSYLKSWGSSLRQLLARETIYQIKLLSGINQTIAIKREANRHNNSSENKLEYQPRKIK